MKCTVLAAYQIHVVRSARRLTRDMDDSAYQRSTAGPDGLVGASRREQRDPSPQLQVQQPPTGCGDHETPRNINKESRNRDGLASVRHMSGIPPVQSTQAPSTLARDPHGATSSESKCRPRASSRGRRNGANKPYQERSCKCARSKSEIESRKKKRMCADNF